MAQVWNRLAAQGSKVALLLPRMPYSPLTIVGYCFGAYKSIFTRVGVMVNLKTFSFWLIERTLELTLFLSPPKLGLRDYKEIMFVISP